MSGGGAGKSSSSSFSITLPRVVKSCNYKIKLNVGYKPGKTWFLRQSYIEMMHGRYMDFHEETARNKIWITEQGQEIPYNEIADSHLEAIIKMLETRKTNRSPHYKGIVEEKLKRTTQSGKLLYEHS